MILGLAAGLMINVYYPNAALLSVLAVESVYEYRRYLKHCAERFALAKKIIVYRLAFAIVFVLSLSPTFATRYVVYGGVFETGYIPLKSWLWTSPQFSNVLFSSNHGLLLWTPIIIFSLLGLCLFAIHSHEIGTAMVSATVSYYLLICLYPDWAGISSFGNRFFISLTPLFVIGLAFLFQRTSVPFLSARLATLVFSLFAVSFVLWNGGLMLQWGMHLIPVRGPVSVSEAIHNQIVVVPKLISNATKSYMGDRKNLMIEIERRDINQLKKSAYQ
jgi:hypothetical protein